MLLKKSHTRKSSTRSIRETEYEEGLESLFEIAVSDALEIMDNEEDKRFLIGQRNPEREGRISSVKDRKLALEEKEAAAKKLLLTVHWDGKIVPDLIGKTKVDRIANVVTGVSTDKILEIPKINQGTGRLTAEAIFKVLVEWDIDIQIKTFSFDTTSVNTGTFNGAAVLLEELLDHQVLFLACRHHIFELLLEAVFMVHLSPSGGPDIVLFKNFQLQWPNIDAKKFRNGLKVEAVQKALGGAIDETIQFAEDQIKVHQPRDDYRELLMLVIIFLGGAITSGYTFAAPGAFNKTRWLSKAIYSLKIWMLRDQFLLTEKEQHGLLSVNIFTVKPVIRPNQEIQKPCFSSQLEHPVSAKPMSETGQLLPKSSSSQLPQIIKPAVARQIPEAGGVPSTTSSSSVSAGGPIVDLTQDESSLIIRKTVGRGRSANRSPLPSVSTQPVVQRPDRVKKVPSWLKDFKT
ncbi:unnamed protein product [Bemisia tabaci]|uniref:Uncharacterized protein n=1 Tax=Bemisia tabaci TaxID=7038 RepID=A0A9P0F0L2_BEMTA|nr:unnamed protein product [Bemisia tabaci]